jgi:hypothetical protein
LNVLEIQADDWQFAPAPAPQNVLVLPQRIVPVTPLLPQPTEATARTTVLDIPQGSGCLPTSAYRCIAHDAISGWWVDVGDCNALEGTGPCGSDFVQQPDGSFRFSKDLSLVPCSVLPPWAQAGECAFDAWGCVCIGEIVALEIPTTGGCALVCSPPFHLDAKACRCIDPPVPFGVPIPHLSRFV